MKLRKLFTLTSLALGLFSFAACKNENTVKDKLESFELYRDERNWMEASGSYLFMMSDLEKTVYEDNKLEVNISVSIINVDSTIESITIQDYEFYGNDEYNLGTVYSVYNYESKESSVEATAFTKSLAKGESYIFNISGVVPQGNPNAYYSFIMSVNDVKMTIYTYAKDTEKKFCYVHNPSLNAKVLSDAKEDAFAVYGYLPREDGALSSYVEYDFTDAEVVATSQANRIAYHNANNTNIKALETKLRAEGKTIEEIAKACSALRNENRLAAYDNDPEGLASAKAYNLKKYGNENGPTPEYLFDKYKQDGMTDDEVWQIVLEKSYSINAAMDAILGLYDDYFSYYNIA